MKSLWQRIHVGLCSSSDRAMLMRSVVSTASIKAGSIGIAFLASLIFARALGVHGYGIYAYVLAWTSLLAIPSSLGINHFVMRESAWKRYSLTILLRWGDRWLLLTGTFAAFIMLVAAHIPALGEARIVFMASLAIPLLTNLTALRSSLLQSQDRYIASQWPQLLLAPALTLTLVVLIWLFTNWLSTAVLMVAMTCSWVVAMTVSSIQLRGSILEPFTVCKKTPSVRKTIPFMWLGMLYVILNRSDIVMLGTLAGPRPAGVYSVSSRAAELVTLLLIASGTVIAPRVAALLSTGDTVKLQALVSSISRRSFMLTLPVAFFLIAFAPWLLKLLYGIDYVAGSVALQILTVAQLFNVFTGPSATVLNMMGHEKKVAWTIGIAAVCNIALDGALIPWFGATGAAFATGICIAAWNVALAVISYKATTINTVAL